MEAVETDKKVNIFYQVPYPLKAYHPEAFKEHLKVSEPHNGAVGYHPILAAISLQ